jgi:hypothetical protein
MMEAGGVVVAVLAMAMVLLINWRAMQSQNIAWAARLRMLLIWGVIILVMVLIVRAFET